MLTAKSSSGLDISQYREWAEQFPQFPMAREIQAMTEETRSALLAIIPHLRIYRINLQIAPDVRQTFESIEEEFDNDSATNIAIEQKLFAAVSWLRHVEMNLLGNDNNILPFHTKTTERLPTIIAS